MIRRRFEKILAESIQKDIIETIVKNDLKGKWLPTSEESEPITKRQWKKYIKKINKYYLRLKIKVLANTLYSNNRLKFKELPQVTRFIDENINVIKKAHLKAAKKAKRRHNRHVQVESIKEFFDTMGEEWMLFCVITTLAASITSLILDITVIALVISTH